MNNQILKPCPFCGGEVEREGLTLQTIYCEYCQIEMNRNVQDGDISDVWNNREELTG